MIFIGDSSTSVPRQQLCAFLAFTIVERFFFEGRQLSGLCVQKVYTVQSYLSSKRGQRMGTDAVMQDTFASSFALCMQGVKL
jgi:hypothetical protein